MILGKNWSLAGNYLKSHRNFAEFFKNSSAQRLLIFGASLADEPRGVDPASQRSDPFWESAGSGPVGPDTPPQRP